MRVDKYLWAMRIFKTRSLSTEQVKTKKITVNQKEVKPARELKIGDKIVVRKGAVYFEYKVLDFPKSRVGATLVPDYILDLTTPEELEKLEMIRLAQKDRPRGIGRPTKRERRDIDKYFE